MTNRIPINLATEDEVSEAILRKLLARCGQRFAIGKCYCQGGFGYLKRLAPGLNRAARSTPFLLLTDLDRRPCATALIEEWIPEPLHSNLLFRVAIAEVEAWLLSDRAGIAKFLQISQDLVPRSPETLEDPKEVLINLARQSRSRVIREDVVPPRGSSRSQGPGYNGQLKRFIAHYWNIGRAMENSDSLTRCVRRIEQFLPRWNQN